jgi:hypothetical protein
MHSRRALLASPCQERHSSVDVRLERERYAGDQSDDPFQLMGTSSERCTQMAGSLMLYVTSAYDPPTTKLHLVLRILSVEMVFPESSNYIVFVVCHI